MIRHGQPGDAWISALGSFSRPSTCRIRIAGITLGVEWLSGCSYVQLYTIDPQTGASPLRIMLHTPHDQVPTHGVDVPGHGIVSGHGLHLGSGEQVRHDLS